MEAADIYSVANENQFRAKRIAPFKQPTLEQLKRENDILISALPHSNSVPLVNTMRKLEFRERSWRHMPIHRSFERYVLAGFSL